MLVGRLLFSCLNDAALIGHIQTLLQRKLSAIKLPGFMEEVRIAHVHLGDRPPLIHRVATPRLDERGTWLDADVTYEGLMHMTITTKLNLLRLRRQQEGGPTPSTTTPAVTQQPMTTVSPSASDAGIPSVAASSVATGAPTDASDDQHRTPAKVATRRRQVEALFDSDAESSGASSSESDASLAQPSSNRSPQDASAYAAMASE